MAEIIISKYKETPVVTAFIDDKLEFISIVRPSELKNIYVARVENIIKNIDAAFVKYSRDEIGYLSLKNIASACVINRELKPGDKLKQGDLIVVQVESEAVKTKKTKLTTNLSISGEYTAVTLGRKGVGASLKLSEELREKLIANLKEKYDFHIGNDPTGVIIRTNAIDINQTYASDIIFDDARSTYNKIQSILNEAKTRVSGSILYSQHSDNIMQEHIEKAAKFIKANGIDDFKIIEDSGIHGIPSKIESFTQNKVWLKSGAFIIIEQLESFNAIDVNTGKAISGKKNIIDKINFEAADEIMRQIRIRNLTGMILIDFINMQDKTNNQKLIDHVIELSKKDPIHINFIDITGLGIMEITRNKNDKSLKEILRDVEKAVDNSKYQ